MASGGKNLTAGPLGRQILVFSLPLVLSNLLQAVFNMTDIAVVGRFAGSQALGSVGSTTIFITLMTGFLIGLGGGVNVLVARFYGAEQPRDVEKSVHSALLVCLAAGVLLLAVGVAFSPALMRLLGTKPDLIDGAILYLRIYFLGMPAMAIYNFGNGVFSAVGDTRKPLVYLTIAGVLNVGLDLFFVIVWKMSVAGAALATILSQYLSAFLILRALARTEGCYGLQREKLRLDPAMTRSILGLGVPAGCQNAIFALANLFIQASINTFDTVVVSGNAAAANADPLVYDVMAAFYTACASFMSQNYGAGKPERVKKSYFISLGYSFGIGAALGLSLVVFGQAFLSLFTTEPAVAEAGMQRLLVMGLSYPISAFMDCTIAASRGLGRTIVPTFIVIMGSCVFRVIWVYTVFAFFGTLLSLYLLFVCSWTITAIAEGVYFVHIYKEQMKIFGAA
ncbi:MAG TPA: MATE family efflux transporter [Candidatus Faecalibacterium intestinigallinarum]|uniref:Probable multidrug resistance protein NorM n=1 Tax=Candidatus Faecalibacterium intestinigallinarum TaxID=2838581 RepID=A0A9D1TWJ1_9FIRM|nr:MATE family efflux transporter [Candidatus Faecalibacterium intestinigallinarum]